MKSMPISSAIKHHSSSKPPLGPNAKASEILRVHDWKTIRSEHFSLEVGRLNRLQIRQLNCKKISNTYRRGVHPHQRQRASFLVNGTSEFPEDTHDSGVIRPQTKDKPFGALFDVIYRYSRPYALIGTAWSIICVSLLAVERFSDFTPSFILGLFQAIIGGSLINMYVVTINQLSDIDIDKVNKPNLPLASGELSVKSGVLITMLYAILGFFVGWIVNSWPLRLGLFLWFAFGTAYSVDMPLLRWKRIPALAAMCIWSVQGGIIPILFYLHIKNYILGRPLILSKHAIFASGLLSIFAVVIALFKDIPDVEGDKVDGINSIALQVGQTRVFWICIWLLEMAYVVAVTIGLLSTHFFIRSIMVISHSILGSILWKNANSIDLKSVEAIQSFYMFIWKLASVEYLLVSIYRF